MSKQKPKQPILKKESQKQEKSADRGDRPSVAGDILEYRSVVRDPVHIDERDGKMYLCLGDASSKELGKLGAALSGSFSSIKIVAVLEECGEVNYFLDEELLLIRGCDDR